MLIIVMIRLQQAKLSLGHRLSFMLSRQHNYQFAIEQIFYKKGQNSDRPVLSEFSGLSGLLNELLTTNKAIVN